METAPNTVSSSSLHPALWIAAISVTLLSLVGIAALTGLLPARPVPNKVQPAAVAANPPPAPAATAPTTAAGAPETMALPASVEKTPPPRHRKTARMKAKPEVPVSQAALPPFGSGVPPDYVPSPGEASVPPPCADCGVIADVRQVTHEGQGSGVGAVVGGVVGGALANNIGRGNGRTLATLAGALGGGLLGNTIEKSRNQTVSYQVTVRMEDGTTRLIDADTLPPWRIGDQVKLVGGVIVSRR